MSTLNDIDSEISKSVGKLEILISELLFTEICNFKLNESHVHEIPWGSLKYSGIYLIEIKNNKKHHSFSSWLEEFRKKWEDEKYHKKWTPSLKKKRAEKHVELKEWIPIYIGKSKKIEGRIHEHIFKEIHKTTFALKLNARLNLKNETFRLQTIKCDVKNYDMLVPFIESNLRDKINPIIGKQ